MVYLLHLHHKRLILLTMKNQSLWNDEKQKNIKLTHACINQQIC